MVEVGMQDSECGGQFQETFTFACRIRSNRNCQVETLWPQLKLDLTLSDLGFVLCQKRFHLF